MNTSRPKADRIPHADAERLFASAAAFQRMFEMALIGGAMRSTDTFGRS
jgi:hypothetical protein